MKYKLILFILFIFIIAIISNLPDDKLHIVICDVGQGDGILISKNFTQIVVDAGPNNSIESCLGNHMPFWDRTIEVAIMTHADSDHSFGFNQMFNRYKVENFVASPVDNNSGSEQFSQLKNIVVNKKIQTIRAARNLEIKVSDLSYKIIFPSEEYNSLNSFPKKSLAVLGSSEGIANELCLIGLLTYKFFSGLFTCDASPKTLAEMVRLRLTPKVYFLKVPHHGSKNGLIRELLEAAQPKLAAISVGAKNTYGHPSPEVVELLKEFGTKTLRTDLEGELEIITDGTKVWVK